MSDSASIAFFTNEGMGTGDRQVELGSLVTYNMIHAARKRPVGMRQRQLLATAVDLLIHRSLQGMIIGRKWAAAHGGDDAEGALLAHPKTRTWA